MTKPWVIVLYMSAVTLSYFYLDKPIAEFMRTQMFQAPALKSWVRGITHLGIGSIYFIAFFFTALFFRYVHKKPIWERRFWFLWVLAVGCSIFCVVLKMLLGRARPELWFGSQIYGFYGLQTDAQFWSFPSGHTTAIMSVAYGVAILFPRYSLLSILIGLMVAVSRILLIQHYLSDIAIAFWLTLIEVALFRFILEKKTYLNRKVLLKNLSDRVN